MLAAVLAGLGSATSVLGLAVGGRITPAVVLQAIGLITPTLQAVFPALHPANIAVAVETFDNNLGVWLQKFLNRIVPNSALVLDGSIGPQTKAALDSFLQAEVGLIPNGALATWAQQVVADLIAANQPPATPAPAPAPSATH